MNSHQDIARKFLLRGIQDWGQSAADREQATREYVNAAHFVFGSREGNAWLDDVLKNIRRGEFNSEAEQLEAALDARDSKSRQLMRRGLHIFSSGPRRLSLRLLRTFRS